MHCPSVFNRVRVSDRDGEFVIVRVDHLACSVDLCPTLGGTAIEANVPFNLLSDSSSFDSDIECVRAGAPFLLDSSLANLRASRKLSSASRTASANIRDVLQVTFETIRASHQCIIESDKVIARAQFGPPA